MVAQQVKQHYSATEICLYSVAGHYMLQQAASFAADQRGSKRKSVEPDPKAKQRMQGMFKRAPARAVQRTSATDQSSEDLLSDILGSIGGEDK